MLCIINFSMSKEKYKIISYYLISSKLVSNYLSKYIILINSRVGVFFVLNCFFKRCFKQNKSFEFETVKNNVFNSIHI